MASPFPFVAGQVLTAAELNEIEPQLTPYIGYSTGLYYGGTPGTAAAGTVNTATFLPLFLEGTFDRIQMRSGGTVPASANFRLGIYNNNNGVPGTVVLDAGTVAVSAINTNYEIVINQTLSAGWYWLAQVNQTAASTVQRVTGNSQFVPIRVVNGVAQFGYQQTGVSGAFATYDPALASSIAASVAGWVGLRYSS